LGLGGFVIGQHAQDSLDMCIDHEAFCDDYVAGRVGIHEAYEAGIINELGQECDPSVESAWDRSYIPTKEAVENELAHAVKDFELAHSLKSRTGNVQRDRFDPETLSEEDLIDLGYTKLNDTTWLNKEASNNLYKEFPTCNCCRESMTPQEGKFGKFYYCKNRCEGQKTVSDKYWQSVRINFEENR